MIKETSTIPQSERFANLRGKKERSSSAFKITNRQKRFSTPKLANKFPADLAAAFFNDSYLAYNLSKRSQSDRKTILDADELPSQYGLTTLTLLAREPYLAYADWEIASSSIDEIRNRIGSEMLSRSCYVLRMYDVTMIDFNGHNAHHTFDIEVGAQARNWYIHLWNDCVSYCADLGVRTPDGQFICLARSNVVTTPRSGASGRTDMIWMDVKDNFKKQPYVFLEPRNTKIRDAYLKSRHIPIDARRARRKILLGEDDIRAYYWKLFPLLKLAKSKTTLSELGDRMLDAELENAENNGNNGNNGYNGFEQSPIPGLSDTWARSQFQQKRRTGASEELVTSGGASELLKGGASERQEKKRKFFFEIGAELIVYGRTEPDATVWLGDKKIKLRQDGTFSLRYSLPDGKIPFDFRAQSFDQVETRSISTAVERSKTIYSP